MLKILLVEKDKIITQNNIAHDQKSQDKNESNKNAE
jgi:hypothetical protein